MKKFLRLVMPVVIAIVLGPLVGGLLFCLVALVTVLFDQTGGMDGLLGLFVLYIMFAYFSGGPIALLAGILMSVWMIWRPPNFLAAIGSGLIAVLLFRLADEIGLLDLIGGSLVLNNFALTLAVAAIAGGVCWLLTRRFVKYA
jgi:hypothetical protein